jgi:predicted YcjX-like family ATPase
MARLDLGLGDALGGLWSDLGQLTDRALDRHLRLAVTGLRRSGKTVFVTALIHHLLDGGSLPFLAAEHEGRYLGARLLPPGRGPAFPFERFLADLSAAEPRWPRATDRLSSLRLEIRFRTRNALLRPLQPLQHLTVEIIDYPGEWLLDLPLLEASFETLSAQALELAQQPPRAALAAEWLGMVHAADQTAPVDPELADRLAAAYTRYLERCQHDLGLSVVQPGRFTNPGEHAGSELLRFCPLPPAGLARGTLRAHMAERFERYREEIVRAFYEDHFSTFDRQIVLVDLLSSLNQGPDHFADTQRALDLILGSFRYGRSSWLGRILAPRIDRLLFAASKADHVAPSQHAALKQLLELMIRPAARSARLEGIQPEVLAIASLRCTDVVRTEHHGQALSCLRGRLKEDGRETVLFPGEIPPDLPEPEDWLDGRFRFREFAPRRLRAGEPSQHIRLDQAIEFLIGDKLR